MTGAVATVREELARQGSVPLDAHHIAALLEMNGWTDSRASRLGYPDLFALAAAIDERWPRADAHDHLHRRLADAWLSRFVRAVAEYVHGLAFAVPMVLASLSVFTLRYSLWSYLGFSTEIATGIALGMFGSFVVTGGFVQMIARRGLMHAAQGHYILVRHTSLQLMVLAVLCAIGLGLVAALVVAIVPVLPWAIVRVALLYYIMLTLLWLGIGLLYMLQLHIVTLGLLAGGIGLVYYLHERLGMPLMSAQALGMAALAGGATCVAFAWLSWLNTHRGERLTASMPRPSQLAQSLAPYFVYGVGFYTLLFADRLIAWSVPSLFHPYFIWFRGEYELGLNFALWTLVLPFGLVEPYLHGLFRRINAGQRELALDALRRFSERALRQHVQHSAGVLAVGLVSVFGIVALINAATQAGWLAINPLADPVSSFVFAIAAPTYAIVAVGLQNALVCFSLNAPWPVVRAVGWSVLVNFCVGFLLSRYIGYEWAVVGLAAGALVFVVMSTIAAVGVLRRVDLHLMQAV